MNEVKIVRIEAIENSTITKVEKRGRESACFEVPVRYILEDGRRIDSFCRGKRKKDVKAYADSLPLEVNNMAVVSMTMEITGERKQNSI